MPRSRVTEAAVPAEKLKASFPKIDLPIRPPFPPMEAKLVDAIPPAGRDSNGDWQYEPKWDGFRCVAFRRDDVVLLQSKAGQPLGRYFPELVSALASLPQKKFVLDGEIVIERGGLLSFDDLLMRIHPAESRIRKLAKETPASMLCFDLLVDERGKSLIEQPLSDRRTELEKFFEKITPAAREERKGRKSGTASRHPDLPTIVRLSPVSRRRGDADRWMKEGTASGLDGVVAKRLDLPYESGERAMRKIKRVRTADCVVGGFRYASKGGDIGSLLLGLYGDDGRLHHVGFTSSFTHEERNALKKIVLPLRGGEGFTGRAPGGPSRWSTERSGEWEPLKPKLVCEARYDHFSGERFRHGTKFLRWRPDKDPKQCGFDQVLRKPDLTFFLKIA
jgi:ATP-dependent DNA ligase